MRSCRVCGCTDGRACPAGCSWVEPDLCSACDDAEGEADPCRYGHRVLWTGPTDGYCVSCGEAVHG